MSALPDPLSHQKYFSQYSGSMNNRNEIETYDNIFGEYSGVAGIPIEYYTISVDDYKKGIDVIYGENSTPKWDKKFSLTAILDNFSQEVIQFNSAGLQNDDEITLYIHRSTFDSIVGIRTQQQKNKSSERRGAFGPVALDQIQTLHNGLIYEVLTGGLHFLSPQEQLFGHKFWYKLTCKIRQTSDATVGSGEQYGSKPDPVIDAKWKGNPQFNLPTPDDAELFKIQNVLNSNIISTSGNPDNICDPDLTTGGSNETISESDVVVPNTKENSLFSDKDGIEKIANEVVDPQTNLITQEGSPENIKNGPQGRVIKHKRDLWNNW